MLSWPASVRIYLARGATDMRKQIDTLAGLVAHQMDQDPTSGHLFVFCNRSRDRLKILYWERGGYWLLHRRLEAGRFVWPDADTPTILLSSTELHAMLGGLDFRVAKRLTRFEKTSNPLQPPAAFTP